MRFILAACYIQMPCLVAAVAQAALRAHRQDTVDNKYESSSRKAYSGFFVLDIMNDSDHSGVSGMMHGRGAQISSGCIEVLGALYLIQNELLNM